MADAPEYRMATRADVRRYLQRMDPEAFEHFVADLWERVGWRTRVVGKPGDRGIDVVASTPEGDRQLIQAKRYGPNTTVGSPEVQQYASLRLQAEGVSQVTIATTGSFSRQAEELAPDLDVILVDGSELVGMVLELDAEELVADYIEGVELRSDLEVGDVVADRGLVGRLRSLVGR